jgi:hypothetical protein
LIFLSNQLPAPRFSPNASTAAGALLNGIASLILSGPIHSALSLFNGGSSSSVQLRLSHLLETTVVLVRTLMFAANDADRNCFLEKLLVSSQFLRRGPLSEQFVIELDLRTTLLSPNWISSLPLDQRARYGELLCASLAFLRNPNNLPISNAPMTSSYNVNNFYFGGVERTLFHRLLLVLDSLFPPKSESSEATRQRETVRQFLLVGGVRLLLLLFLLSPFPSSSSYSSSLVIHFPELFKDFGS